MSEKSEYKTLGILGGLGPQATCDFLSKIIQRTPARCDQDHIPIILHHYPQVPERMASIQGTGRSAGTVLVKMAKDLEIWGADFLAMPCNTAHYYESDILEAINIPFISMIKETTYHLVSENIKKVGLLATKGTIEAEIYHKSLNQHGIELVLPEVAEQKEITELILGVKAKEKISHVKAESVLEKFHQRGIDTVILGCSELPLIFKEAENLTLIDPTTILSETVINYARDKGIRKVKVENESH